jgi:ring-1,2-phenylacetyl-CoA epoxidase subunit PaaC
MSNLAMAHATAISAREFQDMPAPARYMLHLGDNALILAQRLGEWGGHGPILEEDISLTNTALDLLGQARLLYTRVGELHAKGLSEDDYAYWRNEFVFFNWTLCELPNAPLAAGTVAQDRDYAITVVRNALYSALMLHMWQALQHSVDPQLAGIAAKSVKETRYHWQHARMWLVRLGDGTDQSHAKAQNALVHMLPYMQECFNDSALDQECAHNGVSVLPSSVKASWLADMHSAVAEATLTWPSMDGFVSRGKLGQHSEHMGFLLADMQSVTRAHPGARW